LPKSSAYDDDEEREEYGQMKKPTGNLGTGKSKTPTLDNFGRDLTALASEGKLDPVIGREKEIERVSQILSRRKKNNPLLIGEPGVFLSGTYTAGYCRYCVDTWYGCGWKRNYLRTYP
jgi:ATP-dependent Clp protease ATP-binding subunit ClpC